MMDYVAFIDEQVDHIRNTVGDNKAINALSGGVDSAVATVLANKAIGDKLRTCFIENGLMRKGEAEYVVGIFKEMGIHVELVDASEKFFNALKGLTDPEEKRDKGITQVFYKEVFGPLVKEWGAAYLLHGTNKTDVDETVAGIKRQHNILEQLGIDPEKEYGYKVLEPLVELRKDDIREVGKLLGLPEEIYNRPPFPGPALATRVIGEVTPERVETVREATSIVEEELKDTGAFQYLAILHEDRVTGMVNGKRAFGQQIEVRCWESVDARKGTPTELPWDILKRLSERITTMVPDVVNVTYNITTKPPSTIEPI